MFRVSVIVPTVEQVGALTNVIIDLCRTIHLDSYIEIVDISEEDDPTDMDGLMQEINKKYGMDFTNEDEHIVESGPIEMRSVLQ